MSELNEVERHRGVFVLAVDDGMVHRLLEEQRVQQLLEELQDKGIEVLCADPQTYPREADTGTRPVSALTETLKTLSIAQATASSEPYWNRYRKKTWR